MNIALTPNNHEKPHFKIKARTAETKFIWNIIIVVLIA